MVGPSNNSTEQLLENAVLKHVTKTFTEADWIELGIETGTLEIIQGNDRLLRALNWGDPDYATHAVTVTRSILKSLGGRGGRLGQNSLTVDQVKNAFPKFKLWLKANDLSLYWTLFGGGHAPVSKEPPVGTKVADSPTPVTTSTASLLAGNGFSQARIEDVKPPKTQPQKKVTAKMSPAPQQVNDETDIFIVHGHDHSLRNEVYIFLQKITGKTPIILDFQASGGRTLIEKLEAKSSKTSVAIVLLTSDDVGAAKAAAGDLKPRARQNVVFEMGFFVGALSRSRVITINDGVEAPSDLAGLVYIPHPAANWYEKLRLELVEAGVKLIA